MIICYSQLNYLKINIKIEEILTERNLFIQSAKQTKPLYFNDVQ